MLFYADDYRMDNDGGSDSQSDDDGGVNMGERGERHSTETLQGAMVSQHYDRSILVEARTTAMSNNVNLLTAHCFVFLPKTGCNGLGAT